MSVYADSSFLVALYVPTEEDPFALWRSVGGIPLPFNAIHRLELRNAIRRRVFETRPERRLTHNDVAHALREVDADLRAEDLVHQPLNWTEVLRQAEQLSLQYTERTGIRAYDLFHLAAAVETGHDTLLTFDDAQARTARLMGLAVRGCSRIP